MRMAAASFCRLPRWRESQSKTGYKRHRKHRTPHENRQEWADDHKRPVNKKGKQAHSDGETDDVVAGSNLPKSPQRLTHRPLPLNAVRDRTAFRSLCAPGMMNLYGRRGLIQINQGGRTASLSRDL